MEIKKLTLELEIYEFSELNDLESSLIQNAQKALKNAYAPHSNFKVGCAVLLENQSIITGNNQENAAYPSGLCAERVAVFAAKSQFPEVNITHIALAAFSEKNPNLPPISPCGACLQVLIEYEKLQSTPIILLLSGSQGKVYKINNTMSLLPLQFDDTFLN